MNKISLSFIIVLFNFCSLFAQKVNEPVLLGSWFGGEDPSEFLLHTVVETSSAYLKENPNGKLVVLICSNDEFLTAFVSTTLNPLAVGQYLRWSLIPEEKIFIARSSNCIGKSKNSFNQYWFVPGEGTLAYEEAFPAENIAFKKFQVDNEYKWFGDEQKIVETESTKKHFIENITEFIKELENNLNTKGFILSFSNNKRMKRNLEKVKQSLKDKKIDMNRIKIINPKKDFSDDSGRLYPSFATLSIKE